MYKVMIFQQLYSGLTTEKSSSDHDVHKNKNFRF